MHLATAPGFEPMTPAEREATDALLSLDLTADDLAILDRLPAMLAVLARPELALIGAAFYDRVTAAERTANRLAAIANSPDDLLRDAALHAYRLRLYSRAVADEMRRRREAAH